VSPQDGDCAIAQALAVVGDWWSLLVIRDMAGGRHRFGELAGALGISRRVLAERLDELVDNGVVERRRYTDRPPRDEYHLSEKGTALLPVLVALENWGGRYLLGDGSLTATAETESLEAHRVNDLVGRAIPRLRLRDQRDRPAVPVADTEWTVIYCFPGAWAPATPGHPPGWEAIPGAPGCTLESTTFRDSFGEFASRGAAVHGVSTQRPDQLAAFADHHDLPFPLLSDADFRLTTALRLPVFRVAGSDRLKRLTLIVDRSWAIRSVLYPISDPAGSVRDALAHLEAVHHRSVA
jgi:DNA-binding HxlR family transcriptional regulator/peroxiredoxin